VVHVRRARVLEAAHLPDRQVVTVAHEIHVVIGDVGSGPARAAGGGARYGVVKLSRTTPLGELRWCEGWRSPSASRSCRARSCGRRPPGWAGCRVWSRLSFVTAEFKSWAAAAATGPGRRGPCAHPVRSAAKSTVPAQHVGRRPGPSWPAHVPCHGPVEPVRHVPHPESPPSRTPSSLYSPAVPPRAPPVNRPAPICRSAATSTRRTPPPASRSGSPREGRPRSSVLKWELGPRGE